MITSPRYIIGLSLDQRTLDYSTLSVFRTRLIKEGNIDIFENLLAEIIGIALQSGIKCEPIQVFDSVYSEAMSKHQKIKVKKEAVKDNVIQMQNGWLR